VRMEVEVQQGVHLWIDHENDAATAATVAAVGTTEGFELLPVYRRAAVTTGARSGMNDNAVDEARHRTTFL
jgi:hypothetical protein